MAVIYGNDMFTLNAGAFTVLVTHFGGDSTGGDYVGPIVAMGIPTGLNQRVVTSDVDVRFTRRNPDGLTSKCLYEYRIDNIETFPVSFKVHWLRD